MFQSIVDKVQSWNRKRKYKENVYFRIVPEVFHYGIMNIELIKGPYSGIIYSYGSIRIGEDLGEKGAMASFDIEIVNRDNQDLLNDDKFCKLTGQILLVVIEKAIRSTAEKYFRENLEDETREDYFEESVPERTVSPQNSTIPEERVPARKKRKGAIRSSKKVRSKVQSNTNSRSDSSRGK